jgi:hypothetical protein
MQGRQWKQLTSVGGRSNICQQQHARVAARAVAEELMLQELANKKKSGRPTTRHLVKLPKAIPMNGHAPCSHTRSRAHFLAQYASKRPAMAKYMHILSCQRVTQCCWWLDAAIGVNQGFCAIGS